MPRKKNHFVVFCELQFARSQNHHQNFRPSKLQQNTLEMISMAMTEVVERERTMENDNDDDDNEDDDDASKKKEEDERCTWYRSKRRRYGLTAGRTDTLSYEDASASQKIER